MMFSHLRYLSLIISGVLLLAASHMVSAKTYTSLEWTDLIPKSNLDALLNPPPSVTDTPHDLGGDSLAALSNAIDLGIQSTQKVPTPQEQAYSQALVSTDIKTELDQTNIRLPGFIVPVEYNDDQVVTEFFLVPYFGACIHVPPPPPNQIIYVKYPKGLTLDALYDPFWIEGELKTELNQNNIATAAYALTADEIKPYKAYQQ